ncbi:MAG: HEAT repeat domain-containing protein [Myxococcales bacterium]|nr:HEAT repeat domain-containing protein [Myxococcales bacterium]
MATRSVALAIAAGVLAWTTGVACDRGAVEVPAQPAHATPAREPQRPTAHVQAIGPEPAAEDEGLRVALQAVHDKFACNAVSGCPAHGTLVGFGWAAVPHLQALFARAPAQAGWRARVVHVLADLGHPGNAALFEQALADRDPEVRGHAAVGLALLDVGAARPRLRALADDDAGPWFAPGRLGALWALHRLGDGDAGRTFVAVLGSLADQNLASHAIHFGVGLCARPGAPDCADVLPVLARHPGFLGRRAVARALAAAPRRQDATALVGLAADPVRSIAEVAMTALARLDGIPRPDAAAWQAWCRAGGCAVGLPVAPTLP